MPKVGKKRSDRRWQSPDGTVWASKFEWQVYDGLLDKGYDVKKCQQGADSFAYHSPVVNGHCIVCETGDHVVQRRSYTPDMRIGKVYIETKGYFSAAGRKLLRDFRNTGPKIDLLFLAQYDAWVTKGKTKFSDYFARYLKDVPFAVWTGDLPKAWQEEYDLHGN